MNIYSCVKRAGSGHTGVHREIFSDQSLLGGAGSVVPIRTWKTKKLWQLGAICPLHVCQPISYSYLMNIEEKAAREGG